MPIKIHSILGTALLSLSVLAQPVITAPQDYATVSTLSNRLLGYNASSESTSWQTFQTASTANRLELAAAYSENSLPVTLSWTGTSGNCTVTVKRANDNITVFTATTSGTSVDFPAAEIGRNYIWTVQNGGSTSTGHFYTARQFPRIINSSLGIANARDIGGRTGLNGKVVRQGMIFRSREWDWVNDDGTLDDYPKTFWRDTIGIKLDIDLRAHDYVAANHNASAMPGFGVDRSPIDYMTIPRYHSEDENGAGPFPGSFDNKAYKTSGVSTQFSATQKRKAVYNVFRKFANSANYPIIYHCSHGKDRTGALGFLLGGLLGVSREELTRDFFYSWCYKEAWTIGSSEIDTTAYTPINAFTGSTLADKCAEYIKACYVTAGSTSAQAEADIETYRGLMLEDPESAAVKPGDEPTTDGDNDGFTYIDYYFRRDNGGGTWGSSTGYWYRNLNDSSKYAGGTSPDDYANCYFFWPTTSHPYSAPVCGEHKAGKVVFCGTYAANEKACGPCTFKPHFTSTGHTSGDRTVIEHRAGIADVDNIDIYLDSPYNGNAAVEIWSDSELRVADFVAKTPEQTFLRFPENDCANARFTAQLSTYTGDNALTPCTLGWFSGGRSGTTQYIQVNNAQMKFTAAGRTSGVAGSLVLEFVLGNVITTSTAAMLQITGTLEINTGSSITVDANGKGAGTYKLIAAGTLTDNAGLTSHYTVKNCATGYTGSLVRNGDSVNLVISTESPPDPGPEPPSRIDGNRTWTGEAGDGFWETDGNWSPEGAPLISENVFILADGESVGFNCAATPAAPSSGMKAYTLTAKNGGYIYTSDGKFLANSDHVTFAFNAKGGSISLGATGNDLTKGVLKAVVTDSGSIKINSIGTPSAGSVITNINGALKTNWNIPFTANVTSYIAGTNSYFRPSNGGANIAAGHHMTIAADPARPSDFAYFQCSGTGNNAKMTIGSGFSPIVDVSAFARVNGVYTNTFVSFAKDSSSAMKVPVATVIGDGAANCSVEFIKQSGTLMYMVITSNNVRLDPPVIGCSGGTALEIADGALRVRITNAVRGGHYGYKKAASLVGVDWDIIETVDIGYTHTAVTGDAILSIPLEANEPTCFFKIIVW